MKGIRFDGFHTWDDFSLVLSPNPKIEAPTPKTETIEIPGADGELDLSEYFGDIKFKNRMLTFSFSTLVPKSEFWTLFSTIQDALHGKKMRVILDDDPEFYYYGRVSVSDWKAEKNIGKIVIEVDAEPYKYRLRPTTVSMPVNGTQYIVCRNLRKWVVPVFTTTADMEIVFDGKTYSATAGTFTIPDLQLKQGENILKITGTGTVTIEYQEGGL